MSVIKGATQKHLEAPFSDVGGEGGGYTKVQVGQEIHWHTKSTTSSVLLKIFR